MSSDWDLKHTIPGWKLTTLGDLEIVEIIFADLFRKDLDLEFISQYIRSPRSSSPLLIK